MRRVFTMALASAALVAATPALADNAPTLHGFCSLARPCLDNGTNTPTTVNPPVFGIASSGGGTTGTVLLDILVPNNLPIPASFTISNAPGSSFLSSPRTATLFDANGALPGTPAWTSGQLDAYLGLNASPTNPIGNYLGPIPGRDTTITFQPTATGYYVFQANIGAVTLPGTSDIGTPGQDAFLMQLGQGLAPGSFILGFLLPDTGHCDAGLRNGTCAATANSAAILETRPPLPEPATWAMMLLGFGGIGMAMRRRRNHNGLAQIA